LNRCYFEALKNYRLHVLKYMLSVEKDIYVTKEIHEIVYADFSYLQVSNFNGCHGFAYGKAVEFCVKNYLNSEVKNHAVHDIIKMFFELSSKKKQEIYFYTNLPIEFWIFMVLVPEYRSKLMQKHFHNLTTAAHELKSVNILQSLANYTAYHTDEGAYIYMSEGTIKKLLINHKYEYMLYFMRFANSKSLKAIMGLANDEFKNLIKKDDILMKNRYLDKSLNTGDKKICQGITSKKVKCRRIIESGKYCWQHQK
jgi:hypothetical protein